jgi:putative transposase
MGAMEYQRDEHRIHLIVYHLVWTPRRRKPFLVGSIARDCDTLIHGKCEEERWSVLELAIQPDHVHLFVRTSPVHSASDVVGACKGITSRVLRQDYPHLRRLDSLWTRSFFASTAGNVSSEVIKRYVAAQKGF